MSRRLSTLLLKLVTGIRRFIGVAVPLRAQQAENKLHESVPIQLLVSFVTALRFGGFLWEFVLDKWIMYKAIVVVTKPFN